MAIIKKELLLSRLHFFLFGATIVGETVVTSLVVSTMGPSILSRLNFVNGILLFLLPAFLFSRIDSEHKGRFIRRSLVVASVVAFFSFLILLISTVSGSTFLSRYLLVPLYSFSYLLKTVLFISFWNVASVICSPLEAKRLFPSIASFGFVGGLTGALISRVLLFWLPAVFVMLFWLLFYIFALAVLRSFMNPYSRALAPLESPPVRRGYLASLVDNARVVVAMPLVRSISLLYFITFIAIFTMDYFFWSICSQVYQTPQGLTSFQFSFYIFHSLLTITTLRRLTPSVINMQGFTRVFSYLPRSILTGALIFIPLYFFMGGGASTPIFIVLLMWQVVRYVAFENFFSPVYQMFLASISLEHRGRSKMVIEGAVKPAAIVCSSVILILLNDKHPLILAAILLSSILMVFSARQIVTAYVRSLTQSGVLGRGHIADSVENALVEELRSSGLSSLTPSLKMYENLPRDVRIFLISLIYKSGREELFALIPELFRREKNRGARSIIAQQAASLDKDSLQKLMDLALRDSCSLVRSALFTSLAHSKHDLITFRHNAWSRFVLGETEEEKFLSALFLYEKGAPSDRSWARSYVGTLHNSSQASHREYAILASTLLYPESSEEIVDMIHDLSLNGFDRFLHITLQREDSYFLEKLLMKVEAYGRRSYTTLFMKRLPMAPSHALAGINRYMADNPMSPINRDLLRALLSIRYRYPKGDESFPFRELYGVRNYAQRQAEQIYLCAVVYHSILDLRQFYIGQTPKELWEDALTQAFREASDVLFDAIVFLDGSGFLIEARNELSVFDEHEKSRIVEIVELLPNSSLKDLLIPILENSSWETYSDVGDGFFSKRYDTSIFISTNDRWLSIAGLYWHFEYLQMAPHEKAVVERVEELAQKSDEGLLANLATSVTSLWREDGVKGSDFNVLERVVFLKKCELLASVPARDLVVLAESATSAFYQKGDLVSREGNRANHLYVLRSGSAEILMGSDDREISAGTLSEGDTYGEEGLFSAAIRTASLRMVEDGEVYILNRSALKRMIAVTPSLAIALLSVFGGRLVSYQERIFTKATDE